MPYIYNMILPVGAKVKFLNSGESGVVTEHIDERMVSVYIAAWDMDIPVAIEDLMLAEPEKYPGLRQTNKKNTPVAPPVVQKRSAAPLTPEPIKARPSEDPAGVLIAFEAVLKNDGTPEKYRIFLLNDNHFDIIYTIALFILDQQRFNRNGKLSAGTFLEIGNIAFDDLNDAPEIESECWRITTDGTSGKHEKTLRIKPKVFFGRLQSTPLLGRPAHVFPLFERLDTERPQPKKEEDLQDYTKRHTPPPSILNKPLEQRDRHEVREVAEFTPELDLHIEKLVKEGTHLSNAQIIQLQVKVFEAYMEKAHRLGLERVFIIHGIGKGKLRDVIASRLLRMPEVLTFKNEYHPKYGYGATEVLFI